MFFDIYDAIDANIATKAKSKNTMQMMQFAFLCGSLYDSKKHYTEVHREIQELHRENQNSVVLCVTVFFYINDAKSKNEMQKMQIVIRKHRNS